MKYIWISAIMIVFLSGCSSSKYLTSSYERLAPGHNLIAILPFENIYTGRIPEDIIKEDFNKLMMEDAFLFQRSLYGQLLEESGISHGDIAIDFQDISRTNALLKDAGILPWELLEIDPHELSSLLGVDALVKVTLHKDFLLSDEESVLVDVAGHIYREVLKGPLGWKTWGIDKTSEIYINASVIDGKEGLAVWNLSKETHTDWKRQTNEVIRDINNHISKKFPYRRK